MPTNTVAIAKGAIGRHRAQVTCAPLFDLAVIGENYGQMTGVLAGFAFTALVLLMTPTQSYERTAHRNSDGGAPIALLT